MILLKVGRWFLEVFMSFRFRLYMFLPKTPCEWEKSNPLEDTERYISVTTGKIITNIPAFIMHALFYTLYLRFESAMQIFICLRRRRFSCFFFLDRVKVPFVTQAT